jgi:carbonic anhydrase/acetyltransferase-like protein (isoleucine patch superfamily)
MLKRISYPFRKLVHDFLQKKADPIPPGLWVMNLIFQKLFRINSNIPWMVHYTSRVTGDVMIGKNVWVSFAESGGCYIQGLNGIVIGDDTIFGPGVKIISANHDQENFSDFVRSGPIVIGKRCWIGGNVVILPGVQLGNGVVVGAGSVVNRSFRDNSLLAGVPAKLLKVSDRNIKK